VIHRCSQRTDRLESEFRAGFCVTSELPVVEAHVARRSLVTRIALGPRSVGEDTKEYHVDPTGRQVRERFQKAVAKEEKEPVARRAAPVTEDGASRCLERLSPAQDQPHHRRLRDQQPRARARHQRQGRSVLRSHKQAQIRSQGTSPVGRTYALPS
jgi:hypothetical protein